LREAECEFLVSINFSWPTVYRRKLKSTLPSSFSVLICISCVAPEMKHVDDQTNSTSTTFLFHALRTKNAYKLLHIIWGYETAFGIPIRTYWMPLCYWHK
jgi:hypothetical protein